MEAGLGRLVRIKFWQWMAMGLVVGCLSGYFYGDQNLVPTDRNARVDETFFWEQVQQENQGVKISQTLLFPVHFGVQLVEFKLADSQGSGGAKAGWLFFYSRDSGLPDQLGKMGVTYRFAWWALPQFSYGVWGGGPFLLVGVLWPVFLFSVHRALNGSVEKEVNLDRIPSKPEPVKPAEPVVTARDMNRLRELEAEMEAGLKSGVSAGVGELTGAGVEVTVMPGAPAAPVRAMQSTPVESVAAKKTGENKEYEGVYYPVEHPKAKKTDGFTIVELLVTIGVIAILVAILLPVVSEAHQSAMQLACASNLRSIGQGFTLYLNENQQFYPAAYTYLGETIVNGQEQAPEPTPYVNWSYFLFGKFAANSDVFHCPALDQGGIPPTDTTTDNLEPGQENGSDSGMVDEQAPRLAYTVNEAIFPRNKFTLGFQGAVRVFRYVNSAQVTHASATILATEYGPTAQRYPGDNEGQFQVYSHRPICGFVANDGMVDFHGLPVGSGFHATTAAELDPDPDTEPLGSSVTLNFVGRNHGQRTGYPDQRRSNFLYADGHVETKTIYETLSPFEWGDRFWSLNPNDDQQ